MNEPIDLSKRRVEKVLDASRKDATPPGTAPAAEYTEEVVRLIACTNCHSPAFSLAHDGRVLCSVCRVCIASLTWFDKNAPKPVA